MKMRTRHDSAAGGFATPTGTAELRSLARKALDGGISKNHRLTLILGVVLLLTVTVGGYEILRGLYIVGYLCLGDAPWLEAVWALAEILAGLFVALPLAASLFRLACLVVLQTHRVAFPEDLPITVAEPDLRQIFYPFTSLRAYGRCMSVGLEALGWLVLWGGIPVVGFRVLATQFDLMAHRGVLMELCQVLTGASFLVCLLFGVLMLFLSGRRAGFGYFVFIHEDLSVGELNDYFKGFRRGFLRPFLLRLSLVGWIALSIVAVLVPFVSHTVPYGLCCGAVYGAELKRK